MMNLRPENEVGKHLAIGAASALFIALICYLAVSLYQLGFEQGVYHAAQKRTVAVHHFRQHRQTATARQTSETGGSDSGKLRAPSETENKEPA